MARFVLAPQQIDEFIRETTRLALREARARHIPLTDAELAELIPAIINAVASSLMKCGVAFDVGVTKH